MEQKGFFSPCPASQDWQELGYFETEGHAVLQYSLLRVSANWPD